MPHCSYCKKEASLTREHIIPAYLYDYQKKLDNKVIGWNEVVGKMVGGESKVKDVCAPCNNGALSKLDAYSKKFMTENGLLVENYIKNNLRLRYDYDLLLRWLLKVSFNSSRTDGAHQYLFEKYIPYILTGVTRPRKNELSLLIQMAAPEKMGHSQLGVEKFLQFSGGSKSLNPLHMRICYGGILGASGYTLRMVILGPVVFLLLIFSDSISPGHAATEIRRVQKIERNTKFIMGESKYVEVMFGERSWFDLYKVQIARSKFSS
jgi:hypothetical protein